MLGGLGRCVAYVAVGGFCAADFLPCDTRASGRLACVADAMMQAPEAGSFGACRPLDEALGQGGATQMPSLTPTSSPTPTATRRLAVSVASVLSLVELTPLVPSGSRGPCKYFFCPDGSVVAPGTRCCRAVGVESVPQL